MSNKPSGLYSRRELLKAVCSGLSVFGPNALADIGSVCSGSLYISGARRSAQEYVAVVFDANAKIVATIPLTARGHGAAAHAQSHRACIFARRPGYFINAFDRRSPQIHQIVLPREDRHFYGHGTYSDSGDRLYATENDFNNARGVIGIYDATNRYQRIGELDAYGIGPHEIVNVPDSPLLVVANGGIQTHPDNGREKLNLATMQPSLSIIDSRDGKLLGRQTLADELHQVSIRHLACTASGELWYAGQYEGDSPSIKGLAGFVSIRSSVESFRHGQSERGLTLLELPQSVQSRTSAYLSSVAIAGQHAVYTSAKGSLVFAVNRRSLAIEDSLTILDGSGVAPLNQSETLVDDSSGAGVLITSGTGELASMANHRIETLAMHGLQWDNHVYRL